MNYEHREYIGTIAAPFNLSAKRQTKNGWYLDFAIEVGGKVMPCRVFEEVFESATEVWEVGKKVALFGYLAGEQLRVKVAREVTKPATQKHIAYNGETLDEARDAMRERAVMMRQKGFEPVRDGNALRWLPKEYTLPVNGRTLSKLEFAIEKLGAPYVAHKLRPQHFVTLTSGSASFASQFRSRYLTLLDTLVAEAVKIDAEQF